MDSRSNYPMILPYVGISRPRFRLAPAATVVLSGQGLSNIQNLISPWKPILAINEVTSNIKPISRALENKLSKTDFSHVTAKKQATSRIQESATCFNPADWIATERLKMVSTLYRRSYHAWPLIGGRCHAPDVSAPSRGPLARLCSNCATWSSQRTNFSETRCIA